MIKGSVVCFSRKMGLKRDLNVEPDFHQLERCRPSPHMGGGWEAGLSCGATHGSGSSPEVNAVLGAETFFPE